MTASLTTLRSPLTKEQIAARILSGLQGAGFPTGDWAPVQQGGLERGTIDMVAGALANLQAAKLAAAINAGFLDLATGDWLTFTAKSYYLLDRAPATFTVQVLTLTCSPSSGPFTIAVGELIAVGAGTIAGANRYRSLDAATLPKGGTITMRFQAEVAGAAASDPPGTITTLVTSLPGVTVVNARVLVPSPAALVTGGASRGSIIPSQTVPGVVPTLDRFRLVITMSGQANTSPFAQCMLSVDDGRTYQGPFVAAPFVDLIGGCRAFFLDAPLTNPSFVAGDAFFWSSTSVLEQGSDEESDLRLAARCRARWLTLSDVPSSGTVEIWAKTAAPEVARVRVLADANAALTMLVYVGSSTGRASPGTVVAVQSYIADRLEPPEAANVFSVDARAVVVSGSVQVPRLKLAEVQTEAERLWTAHLASIDIGGTVRLAELKQAISDAGALDYDSLAIEGGTPNIVLGANEVAVPPDGSTLISALTWEPV